MNQRMIFAIICFLAISQSAFSQQEDPLEKAKSFIVNQKWDQAIEELVSFEPNSEVHYWMGYTYYKKDDYSKAIDHFSAIDDKSANLVLAPKRDYYIAKCFEKTGHFDKAATFYSSFDHHPPGPWTDLAFRAELDMHFYLRNDYGMVVQRVSEKAAKSKLTEDDGHVAYLMSYSLHKLERFKDAHEWIRKLAVPGKPEWEAKRQIVIAQAEILVGKNSAAKELVDSLVIDFPDHQNWNQCVIDASSMLIDVNESVQAMRLLVLALRKTAPHDFKSIAEMLDLLGTIAKNSQDAINVFLELHRDEDRPISFRLLARQKLTETIIKNPESQKYRVSDLIEELVKVYEMENNDFAIAHNAVLICDLYLEQGDSKEQAMEILKNALNRMTIRQDLAIVLQNKYQGIKENQSNIRRVNLDLPNAKSNDQ